MSSPSASAEALPGHGFPAMSTDGQPRESPMDVEAKGSSTEVAPEEAKSDDMELDEKVDPENEEAPSDDEAEVEEANESDDDGYYAEEQDSGARPVPILITDETSYFGIDNTEYSIEEICTATDLPWDEQGTGLFKILSPEEVQPGTFMVVQLNDSWVIGEEEVRKHFKLGEGPVTVPPEDCEEEAEFFVERTFASRPAKLPENGQVLVDLDEDKMPMAVKRAIERFDLEMLKRLVRNGADVHEAIPHKGTPLHLAARLGDWEAIQLLLTAGATVDSHSHESGATPLHLAAEGGHFVAVWVLIEAGANVNATNKAGQTAIFIAARKAKEVRLLANDHGYSRSSDGNLNEVVAFLVTAGAEFDTVVKDGLVTVMQAVATGKLDCLRMVIERHGVGIDEGRCRNDPLAAAITMESVEMAKMLVDAESAVTPQHLTIATMVCSLELVKLCLAAGVNVNDYSRGDSALNDAIRNDKSGELVQVLIEAGADVNPSYARERFHGAHPLDIAVSSSSMNVVKILVDAGANVNPKCDSTSMYDHVDSPLFCAVQKGQADMVALLLEAGADANVRGSRRDAKTALSEAVSHGFVEIVQALVAHGADVASDEKAVITAASKGHIDIVELLVASGAPLDRQDSSGMTPLSFAAQRGHVDVINFLLDGGANINIVNTDGKTPLHLAAQYNHAEIVRLLIERNADVNARLSPKEEKKSWMSSSHKAPPGSTALYIAASRGNVDVVKVLVDHGADATIADDDGKVPLAAATHPAVIRLLGGGDGDHMDKTMGNPKVDHPMICIRVKVEDGDTLKTAKDRLGCHCSHDETFFQIIEPTIVAVGSELALLRNGEWLVGAATVRSALGLAGFGRVTIVPGELPDGDEVYHRRIDRQSDTAVLQGAVMFYKKKSLHWELYVEQSKNEAKESTGPSAAVLSFFIARLAQYEIALVEEIEDYLYYHVLAADHVKYFDSVQVPVPPSMIAPALESPLRIPRILHAMFEIGMRWSGPTLIKMPESWESHDDDDASPWQMYDDEGSDFDDIFDQGIGTRKVLRVPPYVDPEDGSLFNRGRGWFFLEDSACFQRHGEYELYVCIGDNVCHGDVNGLSRYGDSEDPSEEMHIGHVDFIIKDLFRYVKSQALEATLQKQIEEALPSIFSVYHMDLFPVEYDDRLVQRPFRSGAVVGRECARNSPWFTHDHQETHISIGYKMDSRKRLFDWL
eukprot:m.129709 g.129709  ORF g.129709 m.129709 type:complete len:1205 (-) comp13684_c0_seq1:150-3764(-)